MEKLLKNGWIALATSYLDAEGNSIVLAQCPEMNRVQNFATWLMDAEGNTVSGNYFASLTAAKYNWNERIEDALKS